MEFTIATAYNELTTGEFFGIRQAEKGNTPQLLAALSSLPVSVWEAVSLESLNKLFTASADGWYPLQYLEKEYDWHGLKMPSIVHINGVPYPIPSEGDLLLGQKHFMQQAVDEAAKADKLLECMVFVLACYYQPLVTKEKFSTDAARAFEETIRKHTSIMEVFPVGTFFLTKLLGWPSAMQRSYDILLLKRKVLRAFRSYTNSASPEHSTLIAMETRSSGVTRFRNRMRKYLRALTWRKKMPSTQSGTGT